MRKRSIIKRKIGYTATSIIIAGVTSMTTLHITAQGADATTNMATNTASNEQVPIPKLVRTIDLSHIGSVVAVRKLSFSPDSRYLAIVVDPELGKTDIVVWDMEKGKPQSHIHCPYQYGVLADHDLLWSRDGKVISFGAKRQWDPMTGEALPDNPAIGRAARLNKDGTKMLTIVGALGQPSYIHVYDTKTWELQKIYLDGFAAVAANWTADDKIFVNTSLTHELYSQVIDGYQPNDYHDSAYRLIDPTGIEMPKTLWIPAVSTGDPKAPYKYSPDVGGVSAVIFHTNKLLLGNGILLDGKTLAMDKSSQDFFKRAFDGTSDSRVNKDGMKIYRRGNVPLVRSREPTPNRVIALPPSNTIVEFGGLIDTGAGFDLSHDDKRLAIGNSTIVQIYQVQ